MLCFSDFVCKRLLNSFDSLYVFCFPWIPELAAVLYIDTSNSNGWAAVAARLCLTLVEADGSSLNRLWLYIVQINLVQHTTPSTQRRPWHNDEKLWLGQSLATEYPRAQEADTQRPVFLHLIRRGHSNTQRPVFLHLTRSVAILIHSAQYSYTLPAEGHTNTQRPVFLHFTRRGPY